jgi:2,4-dienoyl-CoA reductase-like NADH-dependent reductase (Old Yellow Enzyme family)
MVKATKASSAAREAHFIEYARAIRAATTCPIMLTGGMRSPAFIESVLADGSIDVAGLARPLALEPDFPNEVLAGRTEASRCRPPLARPQVLSAATETAWYQLQLQRMGRGEEPLSTLSRFSALWSMVRGLVAYRAEPAPAI